MEMITITSLRKNLYNIIDNVIKWGVAQEVERHGHVVKITIDKPINKLQNLKPHNSIVGDPAELVQVKAWEWNEDQNL